MSRIKICPPATPIYDEEDLTMARYLAELRYYPGDPLEEIKIDDLKALEKKCGVNISAPALLTLCWAATGPAGKLPKN